MGDLFDISIIAPAARPKNWSTLYNSVVTNLQVEFIFVGPNNPITQLPPNFKFIYSNVKPAQCCEIAARNSKGRFLIIFADDLLFEAPYSLDRLVELWNLENNSFSIISCLYSNNGAIQPETVQKYNSKNINSPSVPLAGLMLRESWRIVGGIDSNFIGVLYDLDLALRFSLNGGKVIFSDVVVTEKHEYRGESRLYHENWKRDRKFLDLCWGPNGENLTRSKLRNYPVISFSDLNLITNSQGPRGHWRGNKPILLEFMENLPYLLKRFVLLKLESNNKIAILLIRNVLKIKNSFRFGKNFP